MEKGPLAGLPSPLASPGVPWWEYFFLIQEAWMWGLLVTWSSFVSPRAQLTDNHKD